MAALELESDAPAPAALPGQHPLPSSSSPPPLADSTPARTTTTEQGHLDPCCSRPTTDAPPRVAVCRVRPSKRVFVPPPQYGLVEEGLVRSGQPSELNFPFLERLGLKSCVWLAPEEPNEPFQRFLQEQHITLHHLGADDYAATYDPLSEETVLQALELILDPANAPCLIACGQGRHRTGTVCGLLRKLQRWNLTAILEEYRRYAGPKVRQHNEQFIELFDVQLCAVPRPAPDSST
ncbi:hypothetical protein JCM3775_005086 [Rhodotorula graminis]